MVARPMTIKTETFTRGERVAFLAWPERTGQSGVLLLPPVHGIEPSGMAYAQALAEAGLTALIWEPFRGQPRGYARAARRAARDADR